jgi:hypothetical protein
MPPALVFRHPASQPGTVPFWYRTGVPLFRERTVNGISIFFIPLYQAYRMPDSPVFRHSQLCQSGIGIPTSLLVRHRWSRISSALPSYGVGV